MPAVRIKHAALYFLPVRTRMPLKFGAQVVTRVTCARAKVVVEDAAGRRAEGWGETPLSVAWVWPSETESWETREAHLRDYCLTLARRSVGSGAWSHPIEWGSEMISRTETDAATMPLLARLCCLSPFDLAVWDAFGALLGKPVFDLLEVPLDPFLGSAFRGRRDLGFPAAAAHARPGLAPGGRARPARTSGSHRRRAG